MAQESSLAKLSLSFERFMRPGSSLLKAACPARLALLTRDMRDKRSDGRRRESQDKSPSRLGCAFQTTIPGTTPGSLRPGIVLPPINNNNKVFSGFFEADIEETPERAWARYGTKIHGAQTRLALTAERPHRTELMARAGYHHLIYLANLACRSNEGSRLTDLARASHSTG
jgi:hypothetical protein